MREDYSILLIGQFYDTHTARFVRNLKLVNPKVQIDSFTPRDKGKDISSDYLDCFRSVIIKDFTSFFRFIPILNQKERILNWRKAFQSFVKGRHYDIINIQYPRRINSYLLNEIRQVADNIVLTPWGSDVLRINEKERKRVKLLYDSADYITAGHGRFAEEVKCIYSIPSHKMVDLGFGSETIDYILQNKDKIDTAEAKDKLGIRGYYAISCGYNASSSQRHLQIIQAISEVKDKLPERLVLLFPVTYPKSPEYIAKLKERIKSLGLKALFFDHYLTLDDLLVLRQATDMFIHVQTTDANNASLKEYLLLGKNCINGAWMQYTDLETNNYQPYYTIHTIDELGNTIEEAYKNGVVGINNDVVNSISQSGCVSTAKRWNHFFMSICK